MMPKQLPSIHDDEKMKTDARFYAAAVMRRLRVADIKTALVGAYLVGAQSGFNTGYRYYEVHEVQQQKYGAQQTDIQA